MSNQTLVALGGAAWRDPQEPERETTNPESATDDDVYRPDEDEAQGHTEGLSPVNIRNFSVKCGYCGNYQVIVGFRQIDDEWNEYVYECDQPPCMGDIERSRTVLEIPSALDEYARRDPTWHGGEVHAGEKYESEE